MEESKEDSAPKSSSRELNRRGRNRITPAPESSDVEERATAVVPSPAENWLTDELFVKETKLPRHKVLMKHLKRRGLLHESAAMHIIVKVTEVLREEPNVIAVAEPVSICGDVHGQIYNLPKIFQKGGKPSKTNYLFLGNYVNRGNFGIEVLLYLWSLKLNHPKKFFMLRGNHECRHLAECFTFQKECRLKYSDKVYEACIEAFQCLPLAAVVNRQFFCVHGGLSPYIATIEDISEIDRFVEPPLQGPLYDLLWSDPTRDYEDETKTDQYFFPNEMRGCSYYYGYNAVFEFLQRNGLQGMVRAHEVQEQGYKEYRPVEGRFPSLLTVFSTPDYFDYHRNKGCVSVYNRKRFDHRQFNRVQDPNVPTTQSPVTSIPDYINKLTDAQLDLMNFALKEHNNSTSGNNGSSLSLCCTFSTKDQDELLGDEKSIRDTLNATWIKFLAIREEMKSSLREHYQNHSEARAIYENTTSANAAKSRQPNFEMAKDMNAEDERKRLRREEPSEVRSPVKNWLTVKQLYDRENKFPRLEVLKDHLKCRGLLHEEAALRIIREVTEVLREEPNVIRVAEPVAICGDVHGQFYNLLEILDIGALQRKEPEGSLLKPKETNFLFLGNYVNRGNFGIEVLLYLWSLKLKHPKKFFMLRGNHECRRLTGCFTFQKECRLKYSDKVYEACIKAFHCLPLAAVVLKQLFCVHGGLSPEITTIEDICEIDRFGEPPSDDRLFDLLWSDPTRDYEDETKKDQHFLPNEMRGCSYYYGYDAVYKFLEETGLQGMVRAHEVQEQGHKEYRPKKDRFSTLFTVFSTPDYLDYHTNKGCVSVYRRKKFDHRQFDRVPHPYELPQQSAPIASIPHYIDMLTDAQLDLMNFALNEYNNSTLGDHKSKETIRDTLNATWVKFLAIREQLKSVLKMHYERRYTFDIALAQRNSASEQAEDLNAEDEQLLSFEKAEEPIEKEKTDAMNAETEEMEICTVSTNSSEN